MMHGKYFQETIIESEINANAIKLKSVDSLKVCRRSEIGEGQERRGR